MKRSLTIDGHATSISLEDAFWDELKRIAAADGVALAALVARLDAERWQGGTAEHGLSSTLRLFVLDRLRSERDGLAG